MASQVKATEHYVSRKDGKLYFLKVGEGAPLVFLHANGSSGFAWRNVVPTFAQHFTCYNVDMPGYDHSDIPPRKYTNDDYADAIVELLDSAGVTRASFCGQATGAIVSFNIATRFPDRVNRLVLEGCPGWNVQEGDNVWERWIKHQYDENGMPKITPVEETMRLNPNADRERLERANKIARRSGSWTYWSEYGSSHFDLESRMHLVKAPTLLVYGEKDAQRRREQRMHEGIKGSVLEVVQGVSGSPHTEAPEVFCKLALEFLQAKS